MAFGTALLALALGVAPILSAATSRGHLTGGGHALSPFHVTALRPPALVKAVAQTPDGQLWIGTDSGLYRFDGRRFATVGGEDTRDVVGSEDITSLRTDRRGRLWVATRTGKLMRSSGGVVEIVADDERPAGVVTSLAFDTPDDGWMVVRGALFRLRAGTWSRWETHPRLARIDHLWQAHDGSLVLETRDGWVRLRGGQVEPLAAKLDESVADGARRSEMIALAAGARLTLALAGRAVTAALRSGRRTFLGTTAGLLVDDGAEVITLDVSHGLPDNHVRALAGDRDGGVWVITHGGGLARVVSPAIAAVGLREGLAGNTPFSVSAARDGSIWAGSVGGLTRIDGAMIDNVSRRAGFNPARVRSVLAVADGSVWVTQLSSTLLRYLPVEDRFVAYTLPGVASGDDVTLLFEEASGAVLIGTTTGALFRFRDGAFTRLAAANPRCEPHAVGAGFRCPSALNVAHPRRAGGVHLGSHGQGLTVLDQDRLAPWRSLAIPPDRREPVVTALDEDAQGNLWIGTTRSLLVARGTSLAVVPLGHDGRPDAIYAFQPDDRGRLWLPATRGVLRTTRRDLLGLLDGAPWSVPAVRYTTADGLASDLTMGAFDAPGARSRDGRLWFVSVAGLTVVDPAVMTEGAPPTTIIDEVESGNRKHHWPALPMPLTLAPSDRDLLFRFSAPSLGAPHRVQYRHRLDGVDQRWVITRGGDAVRYVHLDPGRYTFRVSARREDGAEFGPAALLTVAVTPRFHETGAARALLVLVLAVLVWLALRLRARQVAARFLAVNAERQRIGLDLHDTLAQVFSAVGLQVDAVETALERGTPDAQERLKRVKQMLRHGRHAARAVISNLRAPSVQGGEALPMRLEGLATLYPDVKLAVTVTGTPFQLGDARENEVIWIIEQAVSNAVEHGRARHIGVELAYEEHRLVASVRDDGQGFPAAPPDGKGHFGLQGMRERALRARGELVIESCPGAGTEIAIIMPKDRMSRRSPWPLSG